MEKQIGLRVGIVGVGNMGFAHASCIFRQEIKGMTLSAVCDTDAGKRQRAAEHFKGIPMYSDYDEMFCQEALDAVIIATPHPIHGQIALRAFARGLHVLVEKPADISVAAAEQMNRAAGESGKVFGIMFNQRTNPLFQKARQFIQDGEIGSLKRSSWTITNWYRPQSYYDSGSWRATWAGEGGGVLINQAPHNLDLWQWLCGMPTGITAFCDTARYHHIEVEDNVTIFARYANGATGTFITSTGEFPGTNRLEICGSRGKIVLEEGKLKLWQFENDEREFCFQESISPDSIPVRYQEYEADRPETAHRGILQNFTDAILHGAPLLAEGREGIHSLMISNAAYLSQWKGNCEIPLPIDPAEFNIFLEKKQKQSLFRETKEEAGNDGSYKKRWQVRW